MQKKKVWQFIYFDYKMLKYFLNIYMGNTSPLWNDPLRSQIHRIWAFQDFLSNYKYDYTQSKLKWFSPEKRSYLTSIKLKSCDELLQDEIDDVISCFVDIVFYSSEGTLEEGWDFQENFYNEVDSEEKYEMIQYMLDFLLTFEKDIHIHIIKTKVFQIVFDLPKPQSYDNKTIAISWNNTPKTDHDKKCIRYLKENFFSWYTLNVDKLLFEDDYIGVVLPKWVLKVARYDESGTYTYEEACSLQNNERFLLSRQDIKDLIAFFPNNVYENQADFQEFALNFIASYFQMKQFTPYWTYTPMTTNNKKASYFCSTQDFKHGLGRNTFYDTSSKHHVRMKLK